MSLTGDTTRILLISGSYPPVRCGVGDYTALLARALALQPDALTVGVLTSRSADAEGAPAGVEVMPLMANWGFGDLARLLRTVENWRPDIVHIQYPTRGYGRDKMPLILPFVLGLKGFPIVQTWHEPLGFLRGVRYLPCAVMRDTFVTVERDYRQLVPGFVWRLLRRKRRYRYIPVGSMIPSVALDAAERASLKREYGAEGRNLVVYFGFAIPSKGMETLFDIADPEVDTLVLLCDLDPGDEYQSRISKLLTENGWKGRAIVTGYLPAERAARLLAAADAAMFPFTAGVSGRNTSVYAAQAQGTFVLTTSRERQGYDEGENTYYAVPGGVEELRMALRRHSGERARVPANADWAAIAAAHRELYADVLAGNP